MIICQLFSSYMLRLLQGHDLEEVVTCRRNISDERLYTIDCAVCWIKYC